MASFFDFKKIRERTLEKINKSTLNSEQKYLLRKLLLDCNTGADVCFVWNQIKEMKGEENGKGV